MKQHTVESIRTDLLRKTFSAVEFTREALAHAERENPKTNAYLTFAPERALAAARAVDRKIATGEEQKSAPEPALQATPVQFDLGLWFEPRHRLMVQAPQTISSVHSSLPKSIALSDASSAEKNSSSCGGLIRVPESIACACPRW